MGGMWTIPTVLILASIPGREEPTKGEMVFSAIHALTVFGAAEQLTYPLNIWHAKNVKYTTGVVAIYVLPAEAILGPAILYFYRLS